MLIKLKTYISNYRYVKKFFRHPHLRMAYTFQNIYVGQGPFNSPTLFSMVPAAELKEGSFFPMGGMFSIVEKLISAAGKHGVKFHYNSPVAKTKVTKNKAEGPIGSPTFMRYLFLARNIILLRVSVGLLFAISSSNIAGLIIFESLTDTI